MTMFLYGFGLFNHTIDQIKELEAELNQFISTKDEAVCAIFLGAVNHWVTVLLHKTGEKIDIFLLDSSNAQYLHKSDE
jgi:hypothetical protein